MNGQVEFVRGLIRLLEQGPNAMGKVRRWSGYRRVPSTIVETTLEHSFKMALLAAVMLELERDLGGPGRELDGELVVLTALLHDLGEGGAGDVMYAVKNDPIIGPRLHEVETTIAKELLSGSFPAASELLVRAYSVVGTDTPEGRFFNAVERVGYVLYSFPMYERGFGDFVETYVRQYEHLENLAGVYPSVEAIYGPLRPFVKEALARHRGARGLLQRLFWWLQIRRERNTLKVKLGL